MMGWSKSDIYNSSSGPDFSMNSGSFCVQPFPRLHPDYRKQIYVPFQGLLSDVLSCVNQQIMVH
ncbi:hypothetical protein CWD84_17945 [Bacillus siamensis]|uniref:Uncharacterized protein n=1 Tax=Bacillus siamensis TaxID=659243 RepID=A0AAI8HR36_9BACI|nr:hypothetical protein CWD84_17945 [Bacillus siamensis]